MFPRAVLRQTCLHSCSRSPFASSLGDTEIEHRAPHTLTFNCSWNSSSMNFYIHVSLRDTNQIMTEDIFNMPEVSFRPPRNQQPLWGTAPDTHTPHISSAWLNL